MLGGGYYGQRLNKPFKESVTEPEIMEIMKPMIKRYALEREDGEKFGDWTIRAGYIAPTSELSRPSTPEIVPDSGLFRYPRIRKGVLRRQCPCMICDGPSTITGISISFLPIISIFSSWVRGCYHLFSPTKGFPCTQNTMYITSDSLHSSTRYHSASSSGEGWV